MKKILKALILFLLLFSLACAHNRQLKFRPFQLTFAYPLGTNGVSALEYENGISINILYGINGASTGIEFGTIFNYNHHHSYGSQIAGLANITPGEAKGFILGGLFNYVGDDSYGFQVAGISNINQWTRKGASIAGVLNIMGANVYGLNIAGLANILAKNSAGCSIAGVSNMVFGDSEGFQASAVLNFNVGDKEGVQISTLNAVLDEVSGAQFGVINVAGALDGMQIGVLNYVAYDVDALPIGVLSYVNNGYFDIELSADEISVANIKYKMGVEKFYNTFSAGMMYYKDRLVFRYGAGIGSMRHLSGLQYLSCELNSQHIVNDWNWNNAMSMLSSLDLNYRIIIADTFSLFIGPSLNVLFTAEKYNGEYDPIRKGKVLYEYEWSNSKLFIWPGLNGGLSLKL